MKTTQNEPGSSWLKGACFAFGYHGMYALMLWVGSVSSSRLKSCDPSFQTASHWVLKARAPQRIFFSANKGKGELVQEPSRHNGTTNLTGKGQF